MLTSFATTTLPTLERYPIPQRLVGATPGVAVDLFDGSHTGRGPKLVVTLGLDQIQIGLDRSEPLDVAVVACTQYQAAMTRLSGTEYRSDIDNYVGDLHAWREVRDEADWERMSLGQATHADVMALLPGVAGVQRAGCVVVGDEWVAYIVHQGSDGPIATQVTGEAGAKLARNLHQLAVDLFGSAAMFDDTRPETAWVADFTWGEDHRCYIGI